MQHKSSTKSAANKKPIEPGRISKQRMSERTVPHEIVSVRWLVKALLAMLVAAGFALYGTVCLLFYQGHWQFAFFPPKVAQNTLMPSAASIAASSGLPITDIQFDYTEEGSARLDGWWVPATLDSTNEKGASLSPSSVSPLVVLFCPNGRTALPDNVAALQAFHALGVSVFAFDYRGFGASQHVHPSQRKAYADGVAALDYLTATRHIDAKKIVVYGAGLGSAIAVHVARQTPQIAALILESPQPSLVQEVKRELHIHVLPLWLIFQQRFDIAPIVPTLKMPKLFLVTPNDANATTLYKQAREPKQIDRIPKNINETIYTQPAWLQAMHSFLHGD